MENQLKTTTKKKQYANIIKYKWLHSQQSKHTRTYREAYMLVSGFACVVCDEWR